MRRRAALRMGTLRMEVAQDIDYLHATRQHAGEAHGLLLCGLHALRCIDDGLSGNAGWRIRRLGCILIPRPDDPYGRYILRPLSQSVHGI